MRASEPTTNLPTLRELRVLLCDGQGTLKPGSVIHTVMKHPLSFVAGEAQALLTVHHDGIMRVMAEHTQFDSRPLERVRRTRELMERIKFGPAREAELACRSLWDIHDRLRVSGDDGKLIRSTDPELLAVLMVMGQLCSATWNALMTSFVSGQALRERADDLFARMWVDHDNSRAALGIPKGVLPVDHAEAISWVMERLDRSWNDGAQARALAANVMSLPQAYVKAKLSPTWAAVFALPASALACAAAATAVLSLRGPALTRVRDIASPRMVLAGISAARAIRVVHAAIPHSFVARMVDSPTPSP